MLSFTLRPIYFLGNISLYTVMDPHSLFRRDDEETITCPAKNRIPVIQTRSYSI
jgi:hypothetical protein